jgi:RNA polymerase sigma factor (sigma-70 family)
LKVIPTLALYYQPVTAGIARKFCGLNQFKFPEYHAVANLALMSGLHRAVTILTDDNLITYLRSYIRGQMIWHIQHDMLVPVPVGTWKELDEATPSSEITTFSADGVIKNKPSYRSLDYIDDDLESPSNRNQYEVPDPHPREEDLTDLMNELCLEPQEQVIVGHLLEGLTQKEVAGKAGMTQQAVSWYVAKIEEKLIKRGVYKERKLNLTRVCTSCGAEKSLSDFFRNGKYYRPKCKECYKNEYQAGK